jgi:BirA family biotin operon repressor/biotin-[acetyl-CoA-carboxylase] ligase
MSHPPPADLADALASAAPRLGSFGQLQFHATVDSTNDLALALAAAGAPEGVSVLADAQRLGRGRRGQTWFSPAGAGIYLSVIVRPVGAAPALSLVTLGAGVAVARAVRAATGLDVELKWPNDVVLGRPWRKLAGVLCEASGVADDSVAAVVVGIGVNLQPAAFPPDLVDRATSLEAELGRAVDRTPLVVEVLAGLAEVTRRLWAGEREWVAGEWRRFGRAGLGGAAVRWNDRGMARRGAARDIDLDGALVVDADGRAERLVAGEVAWERLSRE